MGKGKIEAEVKIKYAEMVLAGKATIKGTARELGVHQKAVQKWMMRYRADGRSGLIYSGKCKKYSQELKIAAVLEYLEGKESQTTICVKYGITAANVLTNWVKAYNAHKELKPTGGGFSMSRKGTRKTTTYEEGCEIVRYCLDHGSNYGETALKAEEQDRAA